MQTFYNKKYTIWNVDLDYIKNNSSLDIEINTAFNNASFFDAPEKIGEGKSLGFSILPKFTSYNFLYDFVTNEIYKQLAQIELPLYYRRKKLSLKRCWANRIYKNTEGTIHNHHNSLVFLLYYNIPANSSNLVFIKSSHSDKIGSLHKSIPEHDKIIVPVHNGMCILHDGNILHAVSKHNNEIPRDVIVFEFDAGFL